MGELRAGWKQYVWASEGPGYRDYWQRADGNAEVFTDPVYPGYRVNVWRPYKNGPHKRTGASGRMALLVADLATPEEAMKFADHTLPMVPAVSHLPISESER